MPYRPVFTESDSHEEKAPYRVIILKQCFPYFIRKTIVRNTVIISFLTIIDSHVLNLGKEMRPLSIFTFICDY